MATVVSILRAHWHGFGDTHNGSGGRPHQALRATFFASPVVLALAAAAGSWNLRSLAEPLLAAYSLAAGILLTVCIQLAGWRGRLDERAERRPMSEAPARRALDHAVAHCLTGVLACTLAAIVCILIVAQAPVASLWNALSIGLGAYVALTMLLIVSAMWTGYEDNVDAAVRTMDAETLSGRSN